LPHSGNQGLPPRKGITSPAHRHALLRNKTTHVGGNQQFQLPSINSHGALKVNGQEAQKLNGRNNITINRRSHILAGSIEPTNAYGGKQESQPLLGLQKMRTAQPSSIEGSQRQHLKMSIQPSGTNAGRMSGAGDFVGESHSMRNLSTKERRTKGVHDIDELMRQGAANSQMQNSKLNTIMQHSSAPNRRIESQPATHETKNGRIRSTRMSGTKARKVPGENRAVEVEDLPSDISADEWGEIQKFGQVLFVE